MERTSMSATPSLFLPCHLSFHENGFKLAGCSDTAHFDAERNRLHDFCSRSHAAEAISKGKHTLGGNGKDGKDTSKCKFPGCHKGVYHGPVTGQVPDFCSKYHRDKSKGVEGLRPYIDLTIKGGTTSADDFTLSNLVQSHPEYLSISSQFLEKWIKPGTPKVQNILRVEVPADILKRFANYSQIAGNVRRRFHGTGCSARCKFFVDLKGKPCGAKECRMCGISTHGFTMKSNVGDTARRTSTSLRYGDGLYFSSVSGKANDYAFHSEKITSDGTRLRCMFVAEVSAGKAYLTKEGSLPQNMCPPANYDSVVGETGHALNHDELVVYKEEAALPTHLIVYAIS